VQDNNIKEEGAREEALERSAEIGGESSAKAAGGASGEIGRAAGTEADRKAGAKAEARNGAELDDLPDAENDYEESAEEAARAEAERLRRRRNAARLKKRKQKQKLTAAIAAASLLLCAIAAVFVVSLVKLNSAGKSRDASVQASEVPTDGGASSAAGGETSASEVSDTLSPTVSAEQQAADEAARRALTELDPSFTGWNYENTAEKTVYLTFDDGPSDCTPQVLDILDQYGVKATFFVTGQEKNYYDYIAEAYRRGHSIGLHTYSHHYENFYTSVEAYFEDLNAIGELVKSQIGFVPAMIRFPGGASNSVSKEYKEGIMTELSAAVQAAGYQYWDWNMSCGDALEEVDPQLLADNALAFNDIQTVVLLLHDGDEMEPTVAALPLIIEGYMERGYKFEALTKESTVVHHQIFN